MRWFIWWRICRGKPVHETDDATLDRMLDMNLKVPHSLWRGGASHRRSRGSGRIIAIGSRAAVEPSPAAGLYADPRQPCIADPDDRRRDIRTAAYRRT